MAITHKQYLRLMFAMFLLLLLINMISATLFFFNPKLFYYRPWEYFSEIAYRFEAFEPVWDGKQTSDMSRENFFYYQDSRHTYVSTDKDGFRRNFVDARDYQVLISGDSTIFGSGLSDDETLPWKISEKINAPVFNGGRSSLFNVLLRPELSNVKIVVDCITERGANNNMYATRFKEGQDYEPLIKNDKNIYSLLSTVAPQRYVATLIAERTIERMLNDLFIYLLDTEQQYRFNSHRFNEHDMNDAIKLILNRKENVNARGMKYIFVPIPAKQTIYNSNVDDYTKNYISTLIDRLKREGVKTVNLVNIFRENMASGIYYNYDTHWNPEGVEIAATSIAKYLTRNYPEIEARAFLRPDE